MQHWRDRRLAACYDALREIRLLRFLGLEDVVEQRIMTERQRELKVKAKRIYLSAFGWWLSTTLSKFFSVVLIIFSSVKNMFQNCTRCFVFTPNNALSQPRTVEKAVQMIANLFLLG